MSQENDLPSIWQMTKNFSKEVTKYVAEGMPNVTEEEYKRRLNVCASCEFYLAYKARCGACGCLLEHKAKWKTSTCPKKKLAPQIGKYGKVEESTDTGTSE